MSAVRFSYRAPGGRLSVKCRVALAAGLLSGLLAAHAFGGSVKRPFASHVQLEQPLIVTQLPVGTDAEKQGPVAGGMLRAAYGERARITIVFPDLSAHVLSTGFHSACDPEVSFDAKRILFAGKQSASDNWNVFEMSLDRAGAPNRSRGTTDQTAGKSARTLPDRSSVRQITHDIGDCRSPSYQSTLYTIISTKPWYQLTFVGDAGTMNEFGSSAATNLYSCKLDGSAVRRLTYNLSNDMDPAIMPDGRLVFAGWQRCSLDRGVLGRVGLFGINIDGADYALFAGYEGRRIKHMPCVTTGGLAVFVEADRVPWDGAGYLSCVRLRRPLHSYRQITGESDGLYHSPSPLPDGSILVSRRPGDGKRTHGVWRFDPISKQAELVFDDPRFHDIQAKLVHPRPLADGRSSVVTEEDPHGKLYCLNVYNSDLPDPSWLPRETAGRIRVLEGVPLGAGRPDAYLPATGTSSGRMPGSTIPGSTVNGIPPLVQRRILGEIAVEEDGSLNVEVPAGTPIELQLLDADGMALRSCGWIWAMNHEPRGCIGCHEDGELTPENWFQDALGKASIPLCLPPERRRTVDFRRDVMPITEKKCAPCHGQGGAPPRLDGGLELVSHRDGKAYFNRAYESLLARGTGDGERALEESGEWEYVHPGRARTSPLIWRIFGRNTSRPWDGAAAGRRVEAASRCEANRLTEEEKRTFVEWIDLGALWDGIPGTDHLAGNRGNSGEGD